MQRVTVETFQELVTAGRTVVVDFSSTWCAPCRALEKALKAESASRPNLVVLHVDIVDQPALSQAQRITATPTLVGFRNGERVAVDVGYRGPGRLARFLDRLEEA